MLTLILPIINLAVLVYIMVRYMRQPLTTFVEQRHHSIATDLKETALMLQDAQEKYNEFSAKLKAIDVELNALRTQFRQSAEETKQKIIGDAQRHSSAIVGDAHGVIAGLFEELRGELYRELGHQVLRRAEDVLLTNLTSDDRVRIRREFSRQVESVQ